MGFPIAFQSGTAASQVRISSDLLTVGDYKTVMLEVWDRPWRQELTPTEEQRLLIDANTPAPPTKLFDKTQIAWTSSLTDATPSGPASPTGRVRSDFTTLGHNNPTEERRLKRARTDVGASRTTKRPPVRRTKTTTSSSRSDSLFTHVYIPSKSMLTRRIHLPNPSESTTR